MRWVLLTTSSSGPPPGLNRAELAEAMQSTAPGREILGDRERRERQRVEWERQERLHGPQAAPIIFSPYYRS